MFQEEVHCLVGHQPGSEEHLQREGEYTWKSLLLIGGQQCEYMHRLEVSADEDERAQSHEDEDGEETGPGQHLPHQVTCTRERERGTSCHSRRVTD